MSCCDVAMWFHAVSHALRTQRECRTGAMGLAVQTGGGNFGKFRAAALRA